jgi:hypothetical protein
MGRPSGLTSLEGVRQPGDSNPGASRRGVTRKHRFATGRSGGSCQSRTSRDHKGRKRLGWYAPFVDAFIHFAGLQDNRLARFTLGRRSSSALESKGALLDIANRESAIMTGEHRANGSRRILRKRAKGDVQRRGGDINCLSPRSAETRPECVRGCNRSRDHANLLQHRDIVEIAAVFEELPIHKAVEFNARELHCAPSGWNPLDSP